MLSYLYACAFIVLTAPGFIVALRALPWVERQMLAGIRPWACDICMSFWTVAGFTVIAAMALRDWRLLAIAGPAYTLALGLLGPLQRTHAPPPAMGLPALVEPGLAETLEPKDTN